MELEPTDFDLPGAIDNVERAGDDVVVHPRHRLRRDPERVEADNEPELVSRDPVFGGTRPAWASSRSDAA
jgi:hypothetical protein